MDKLPVLLGTAAAVFVGGAVLVFAVPAWRWLRARLSALAVAIDGGIERTTGWDGALLDWDAVAAAGECPECAGADLAQASRNELALLRAINKAGREETSRLRHQVARQTDQLVAAEATIADMQRELTAWRRGAGERDIEMERRERSMRRRRALPGSAMGDA